jgi:RNA polymerase sigma factor (sigma-70 family)
MTLPLPRTRDELLRELVATTGRRGFAIAYDLLRDGAEAEDAVQEALYRVCERWADIDPATAEGWFLRVLTNHCLRLLRRRRVRGLLGRLLPGRVVPDGEGAADLVDERPGADDTLARRAEVTRVLGAVSSLPPMQRAALVLRYGHDLGVPQVATLLGVGQGTVKTHLVRGLSRLRGELEKS